MPRRIVPNPKPLDKATGTWFPSSWKLSKRAMYTHMWEQTAGELINPPRQKGSKRKPITAQEFKTLEKFYELIYGTEHQAGLKRGVRESFQFEPKVTISKKIRGKKAIEKATKEALKKAEKEARAKTIKLMKDIGQPYPQELKYAYLDSLVDPKTMRPFPVKVVHVDKGMDKIIINNIEREMYNLDVERLAAGGKEEAGEFKDAWKHFKATDKDRFSIVVRGDRIITEGVKTARDTEKRLKDMMKEYNGIKRGPHHFWQDFITGIAKLKPIGQRDAGYAEDTMNDHIMLKKQYLKGVNKELRKTRCPEVKNLKRCIYKLGHHKPHNFGKY